MRADKDNRKKYSARAVDFILKLGAEPHFNFRERCDTCLGAGKHRNYSGDCGDCFGLGFIWQSRSGYTYYTARTTVEVYELAYAKDGGR